MMGLVCNRHNETKNMRGIRARGGFQTLPALTDPQTNSEKDDWSLASLWDNPEKSKPLARIP